MKRRLELSLPRERVHLKRNPMYGEVSGKIHQECNGKKESRAFGL